MKKLVLLALGIVAGTCAQAQTTVTIAGPNYSYLSSFNHAKTNSAYEVLYQQSQLQQAGTITRLAFQKLTAPTKTP